MKHGTFLLTIVILGCLGCINESSPPISSTSPLEQTPIRVKPAEPNAFRLTAIRQQLQQQDLGPKRGAIAGTCPVCGNSVTTNLEDFYSYWDGIDDKGSRTCGLSFRSTCCKCGSKLIDYHLYGELGDGKATWEVDKYR